MEGPHRDYQFDGTSFFSNNYLAYWQIPHGYNNYNAQWKKRHGSRLCGPTLVCLESCTNSFLLSDGNCDDGGPGSEFMATSGMYGYCEPGTDCEDCGDRWLVWNPDIEYVDFCDNVKACAQGFAEDVRDGRWWVGSGRRLSGSALAAG